jgi:hypothetical protein
MESILKSAFSVFLAARLEHPASAKPFAVAAR